ncbi:SDR family oxidoreductase [Conexibacter sp. JD483]|uniref:SDR family NAD(P)-dependent oxidoreductase n=1 Tax=unclassified Conexibacter TaxID=2627773 RepID=UPI0027281447|nr:MULTISPECIES: SDR family oxidoreductase [unclassified Conexibacter]MDO8186903.1 SDR family oxidoreductase [Conexibacter sp. CPCC 205706]MDO8200785.1 SDR family oxidoreductase [Conexibacter sp. CPCC 205762]MDR9371977.1 SDR family oxidoreductase [Conexibacter sp. JD483]
MPESERVLISGAAGGMGAATARRFAAGGWTPVLTDLPGPRLDAIAGELDAQAIPADLRTKQACDAVVAEAGALDCLVAAAGLWTEGPAEETTEEAWDRVLDVNLKGLFFLTAAAIPVLARAGEGGARAAGSIVAVSSDAGLHGNTGAAVYCASKGGVSNLVRALALELAPRGVRVNAVCPGDVETPMLTYQAETFGGGDPDGYRRALLASYPQKQQARFTQPHEVAELIWYLAQPAAAPITGANLSIDFGLTAGV